MAYRKRRRGKSRPRRMNRSKRPRRIGIRM